MGAGLEHLSWAGGTLRHVDHLLLIGEPQSKALMTVARAAPLARDLGIRNIHLVGSRVNVGDHEALVRAADDMGVDLVGEIPDDIAVIRADQAGECVLDHSPDAHIVTALLALAEWIAS